MLFSKQFTRAVLFTVSFLLTQRHEDRNVTFQNKETEAQTGLIMYPPLEVKKNTTKTGETKG